MQETNQETRKKIGILKPVLFLLLVVVILITALYSFFHISPLDLFNGGLDDVWKTLVSSTKAVEKTQDISPLEPGQQYFYDTQWGSVVIASIGSVRELDAEGNEKWYVPVTLKKPFIQVYDNNILVADLEGRFFGLIRDGNLIWQNTLQEDIVNASLSQDWILIITKSIQTGYKRTVRAYSIDGQEVSERNTADYYPFAAFNYAQFNPSAFILCGVETNGLETCALFEFVDASMNQKGSIRGDKELFNGALAFDKKLVLTGEKSIVCLDQSFNTLWKVDAGANVVTHAVILKGKYTLAAILDDEVYQRERQYQTDLKIYNEKGSPTGSLTLQAKVADMDADGRTAAIAAGTEVYFINEKGEVMDSYASVAPIVQVFLAREDLAYVITADKVVLVRIKLNNRFLGIF